MSEMGYIKWGRIDFYSDKEAANETACLTDEMRRSQSVPLRKKTLPDRDNIIFFFFSVNHSISSHLHLHLDSGKRFAGN